MIKRLAGLLLAACVGCERETNSPDSAPTVSKSEDTTIAAPEKNASTAPKNSGAATSSKSSETAAAPRRTKNASLAPDFTLVDLQGKNVKLSDFRGKVVLLNFWGVG